MITEDYVSYETAKLLKEKGFNENDERAYVQDTLARSQGFNNSYYEMMYHDDAYRPVSAPTLSLAMKWLREVHNYNIEIDTIGQKSRNTLFWRSVIYNLEHDIECYREENFKSYEEACETAIKYCLEELI